MFFSFLTRELHTSARASCRYDLENGTCSLTQLVNSCKLFVDFRLLSAFDSFWQVINNQMATFVAENSDEMKKKPVIILKEFIFSTLVSTSGTSNWQACKDSHWNKRTTFIFHKIVLYNPWNWKQSEDSLKIPLTPKRLEFTGVQKLFLL